MNDERRPLTIADALVLIAGVAAGLGLVGSILRASHLTPEQLWNNMVRPKAGWSVWNAFGMTVELSAILGVPFVAAWTPASLVLQVLRPRPGWRRFRRRPGFVACLIPTVVATLMVAIVQLCLSFSIAEMHTSHAKWQVLGGMLAGSGVLWGWIIMGLCGVCRPSRTWTDRLGRMTGALWIALGALSTAYMFLAI